MGKLALSNTQLDPPSPKTYQKLFCSYCIAKPSVCKQKLASTKPAAYAGLTTTIFKSNTLTEIVDKMSVY